MVSQLFIIMAVDILKDKGAFKLPFM